MLTEAPAPGQAGAEVNAGRKVNGIRRRWTMAKAKKAKSARSKRLRKVKDPFSFNFGANRRKRRKPAGGGS
jgi:hypothetical protein